jgi:hypothetical protein
VRSQRRPQVLAGLTRPRLETSSGQVVPVSNADLVAGAAIVHGINTVSCCHELLLQVAVSCCELLQPAAGCRLQPVWVCSACAAWLRLQSNVMRNS